MVFGRWHIDDDGFVTPIDLDRPLRLSDAHALIPNGGTIKFPGGSWHIENGVLTRPS